MQIKGDEMNINIKILVVEDDTSINNLLTEVLSKENYSCSQAFSGSEAKLLLEREDFHLLLLDLMLPGLTGEELVVEVRKNHTLPIVIISAKLDLDTKVNLLELGADDFIEKPFDIEEVVARSQAQIRRYVKFSHNESSNVLTTKNLTLNQDDMIVKVNGEKIKLTHKEYEILLLLLKYPKKVFTKKNLYETIWGEDFFVDENTLNVHISNIRNKIQEFDGENDYIETVWGVGFKMKA